MLLQDDIRRLCYEFGHAAAENAAGYILGEKSKAPPAANILAVWQAMLEAMTPTDRRQVLLDVASIVTQLAIEGDIRDKAAAEHPENQ